jgi:hypothetical protein
VGFGIFACSVGTAIALGAQGTSIEIGAEVNIVGNEGLNAMLGIGVDAAVIVRLNLATFQKLTPLAVRMLSTSGSWAASKM